MPHIGQQILNYRITRLIGEGGMGAVFEAQHINIPNDKAAIKVINADMVNGFTQNLLKNEAQHLAALHHTNIVAFKDFHIDQNGDLYLIMEYANGISLDKYIYGPNGHGLIVEDRICPIFEPILDAVGYAHSIQLADGGRGILHRDIKPTNIIITPAGEPRILDFGIAKVIHGNDDGNGPHLIMGTPSYMSPEQVIGKNLDERSDIYSLGVLLHEMLTGHPPYDQDLTEQDINHAVVNDPLPRMKTYYEYISDKVQKVVDKATAKNPDDRYQTCTDFKNALHDAIYPSPVPKWAKIAAIVAVILVIGGGWYTWDYNRVKTRYYKDYVECWGVPKGIGKLNPTMHRHCNRSYKFVYKKRKLIQVSHVNSLGYLIDYNESERNEHPIDQTFSYTANGKVSRVTVRDCGGKVLYVKSYSNENTIIFQYDDEHGTERVVSNESSVGDKLLENPTDSRGRISRWWIDYDKHGYVSTIHYVGFDNTPVGDAGGIYGMKFVRDGKGRETEIHYIGADGQPMATRWGLGIKKFYYDNKDNLYKTEHLTVDGNTAYDDIGGAATKVMEYDRYGNLVYMLHQDGNGKGMIPQKYNIAGTHYVYDKRGFATKQEFLDVDKKTMFNRMTGVAITQNEYDENGYLKEATFYDPDGNPTDCKKGYAKQTFVNDQHGNVLETWFYKRDGKLCETLAGYAGVKSEYDSVGNPTRVVYYGTNKKPCACDDGSYGRQTMYDKKSQTAQITYLGADLKPAPNNANLVVVQLDHDRRGNTTKLRLYGADGKTLKPCLGGWAEVINRYDTNGLLEERSFFDSNEKLIIPKETSYATVSYTYDNGGNLRSERYRDPQGNPAGANGVCGKDYERDKRGNILKETPVGPDGKQAASRPRIQYGYDAANHVVEQSFFSRTGAATDSTGVHRQTYAYNSRNQETEEWYYGTDGTLTLSSTTKAAGLKNEYNKKGERVRTAYYGTDRRPCLSAEGWSSTTYEYDPFGHVTKQCFFDTDGKPADPNVMVPVSIAKYDTRGNRVYVAAQDGHGHFVNHPGENWAIGRNKYDNRNNLLTMSFYDSKDRPAICSSGYHIVKYTYDKQNRKTEAAYYDTEDKPVLVDGCHRIRYTYAENSDNLSEEACFGLTGERVNCKDGWHKAVHAYDNERHKSTTQYYDANGDLAQQHNAQDGHQWRTTAQRMSEGMPRILETKYGLTMKSLTITSENKCEVKFSIPYVSSQLGPEATAQIKAMVKQQVKNLEKALNQVPVVTGKLYDANGTIIFSYSM